MPFVRVIVTRQESTELYIEVPEGFDGSKLMHHTYQKEVARITSETTTEAKWDSSEWEDTVEVQSIANVPESEAMKYICGKLKKI